MIKNKDLYSTSQSATEAYYEARAKNETYKTIVGWLFDEAKDLDVIDWLIMKCKELTDACEGINEEVKRADEAITKALQGEDEPKPNNPKENLCSTCKYGIKVPKSKQPTFRCRRGWNIIVHSCKECDEYERRTEK